MTRPDLRLYVWLLLIIVVVVVVGSEFVIIIIVISIIIVVFVVVDNDVCVGIGGGVERERWEANIRAIIHE